MSRPYVIVSPAWSAGPQAQVMHRLADELCGLGLDAQLLITKDGAGTGPTLNPALRAPALNPDFVARWPRLAQQAITVLADDADALQARQRLRLRFAKGGSAPADEFWVYHSRALPQPLRGELHCLPLLPLDLGLCNEVGALPWAERPLELRLGGDGPLPALDPAAPPAERAALLRQTRLLHSHDAASWLNLEAIACGAVVLLQCPTTPASPWSRRELESSEWGGGGFAFAPTAFEIERARVTRAETLARLRALHAGLRLRVLELVAASQAFFRSP